MNTTLSYDLNGIAPEQAGFGQIHYRVIPQTGRGARIQFKAKRQAGQFNSHPSGFSSLPSLAVGIASQTSGGATTTSINKTTTSQPDSRTFEDAARERSNMIIKNEAKQDYPSDKEIAAAAYLIWEQEGRPGGKDLQHWLEAEAQLLAIRRHEAPVVRRLPVGKPLVAVKAAVETAIRNRNRRVGSRFDLEKLAA